MPKGGGGQNPTIMDILNQLWIFHNLIMDIHKSIMDIHNSIMDIRNWIGLDWICLTTTHVLQDILAVLHK